MSFSLPLTRTSSMAVWSLVCGILCYLCVCIGFVPAIAAILLGHFALSAIHDSAGTLTGRGLAIAGLVLGYAGLALMVVLFAFSKPAIKEAGQMASELIAVNEEQAVAAAVQAYVVEYGRLPESLSGPDDLTLGADNHRLLDILRARGSTDNPKKIVFYEGRRSDETPPRKGLGADGVLYDPWGRPYTIRLDSNDDGKVANPYPTGAGEAQLERRVLIWSPGAEGGAAGDATTAVVSWQPYQRKSSGGHVITYRGLFSTPAAKSSP